MAQEEAGLQVVDLKVEKQVNVLMKNKKIDVITVKYLQSLSKAKVGTCHFCHAVNNKNMKNSISVSWITSFKLK